MTAPTRSSWSACTRAARATPLYAEEILAAGLDGRGSLPPTLRDALMLRVERLSPRAQELIRWLACQPARRPRARGGRGRARARPSCATRCARRWRATSWSPCGDESYGFRHALLREVVYDDLLPGERTEMHAALARRARGDESRAASAAPTSPPQVAHHWAGGRRPAAALAAAVRAATRRRARERLRRGAVAASSARSRSGSGCRTPRQLAGIDEFELLRHAAVAADQAGEPDAPGGAASARARAGGRRVRSRPRPR